MWISPWKSIIEASSHLIIFSLQSTETIKDCLAQHSCVAITISEHMTLCHVSTQGQPKWRSQDKTIILLTVYYCAWFVINMQLICFIGQVCVHIQGHWLHAVILGSWKLLSLIITDHPSCLSLQFYMFSLHFLWVACFFSLVSFHGVKTCRLCQAETKNVKGATARRPSEQWMDGRLQVVCLARVCCGPPPWSRWERASHFSRYISSLLNINLCVSSLMQFDAMEANSLLPHGCFQVIANPLQSSFLLISHLTHSFPCCAHDEAGLWLIL